MYAATESRKVEEENEYAKKVFHTQILLNVQRLNTTDKSSMQKP